MSWKRRKDDDDDRYRKWKEMFPWLPSDFFESSGFFEDDFLQNMMEEIERMMKSLNTSDMDTFRKNMGPMVWGWNMTIGPDGKPSFKEFGNVKPSVRGKPLASKDREPLVDVFIDDKKVRIIAELPGVSKDDINVKATESKIKVYAKSGERAYSTERDLSVKVKPKTASAVYKNGILEITLDRKEPAKAEEGFEVKIE
ncbi:MAG: archaeal heat shock protein Hsp20 [Asgard group archaeon]|nr:archaeal heat shock protein Hsp20 [Asgard group archaeon]